MSLTDDQRRFTNNSIDASNTHNLSMSKSPKRVQFANDTK